MNKYHQEILKEIKNHAGQDTKHQGSAYVGTSKFCYNIKAEIKRSLVKDWIAKHHQLSFTEYLNLLNSLYQGQSHDELSFAGKLLEFLPKLRKNIEPKFLDTWLGFVEGWAEVDSICQSNFSANEMFSDWIRWEQVLRNLAIARNVVKKRASLVLLTKPVRESNDSRFSSLAFENIEKLKDEKDILITKAISWLLRDLIKNHREEVENYLEVNENNLPKIAVRETKHKLLTGKK